MKLNIDIQHIDTQHNGNQHNDIQHNDIQHDDIEPKGLICDTQNQQHSVSTIAFSIIWHYADSRILFIFLLNVIILSANILNVIMLSVIRLNDASPSDIFPVMRRLLLTKLVWVVIVFVMFKKML